MVTAESYLRVASHNIETGADAFHGLGADITPYWRPDIEAMLHKLDPALSVDDVKRYWTDAELKTLMREYMKSVELKTPEEFLTPKTIRSLKFWQTVDELKKKGKDLLKIGGISTALLLAFGGLLLWRYTGRKK